MNPTPGQFRQILLGSLDRNRVDEEEGDASFGIGFLEGREGGSKPLADRQEAPVKATTKALPVLKSESRPLLPLRL